MSRGVGMPMVEDMWFNWWGLGVPGLTFVLVKNGIFKWSYVKFRFGNPFWSWNANAETHRQKPSFKFQHVFWGNDPILTSLFLLMWWNHQLETCWLCLPIRVEHVSGEPCVGGVLLLVKLTQGICRNVHGLVGKFLNISSLRVQNDGNEINQIYFCKLAVSFGFFIFSFCLARRSNSNDVFKDVFFDKLRGNKANLATIALLPVLWYLYVEVFCLHHVYIAATFFGRCRYT